MTLVKEVVNEDAMPREVHLRCNHCGAEFDYKEEGGQYHFKCACPWCHEAVSVPRARMINSSRPRQET